MVKFDIEKNRSFLKQVLKNHKKYDLSIDTILEGKIGNIFVNNNNNPEIFFLTTGPFYILAGNHQHKEAKRMLSNLPKKITVQPSTKEWNETLEKIYNDKLIIYPRYSFSSKHISIDQLNHKLNAHKYINRFKRIDKESILLLEKDNNFSFHLSTFNSTDNFLKYGIGFIYKINNRIVGCVSSALVCKKGIEININVLPEYRRLGYAKLLASQMILYCYENNLMPHWDAANPISYKLAESLGYKNTGFYFAYYLKDQL